MYGMVRTDEARLSSFKGSTNAKYLTFHPNMRNSILDALHLSRESLVLSPSLLYAL